MDRLWRDPEAVALMAVAFVLVAVWASHVAARYVADRKSRKS